MYMCSGAYEQEMYDQCEVGDLSGKYDAVAIQEAGWGYKAVQNDPLPALDYHYVSGTTMNPPNRFSSIVFHNGSPRVLCGKLVQVE